MNQQNKLLLRVLSLWALLPPSMHLLMGFDLGGVVIRLSKQDLYIVINLQCEDLHLRPMEQE